MQRLLAGQTRRRGRRISFSAFYLLASLVLLGAVVKLSQPLGTIRRQQEQLSRLRLEKARLVAERVRLEGYQHGLATERGLERAARREGYIRPGDRRLVFVPEKQSGKEGREGQAKPTAPR